MVSVMKDKIKTKQKTSSLRFFLIGLRLKLGVEGSSEKIGKVDIVGRFLSV